MMVTTGGRVDCSPWSVSLCAIRWSSTSPLSARTTLCPSSSVTSAAVSWSMLWVMVAMTPILNRALTTSPPFSASFCARSATVMVSPMATSRTIGAVGRSKPWLPVAPRDCSWRRGLGLPRVVVRRARSAAERCNCPAKRWVLSSSSTPATIACEPRVLCLLRWWHCGRRTRRILAHRRLGHMVPTSGRLRCPRRIGIVGRRGAGGRGNRLGVGLRTLGLGLGRIASSSWRRRSPRLRVSCRLRPGVAVLPGCAGWIPAACAAHRRARRWEPLPASSGLR